MMKTQRERDDERIASVSKMVTFARPSFVRLVFFSLISMVFAVYQLSMSDGVASIFVSILFSVSMLIALIESARFGYIYDEAYGGWKSSTCIVIGFIVVFILHRIFDYLGWTPTHRTLGWSIALWFGLILGVLLSQVNKGDGKQ
ncbi:hypothetical protein [Microbulbifer sp. THAF38]|uniref:hypothetical protein n=1 Tax=Microbulbifer sp. THAF38 TaxID=2587856 RepID=UPI0012687C18|nr:hypothetical protein [Microbulbifer sp. THAF38]QFT57072.1 hypothetical protein FIU95_21205 [Microbulbifer sp. THAF38]